MAVADLVPENVRSQNNRQDEDEEAPSFSLVTGKYRQARQFSAGGTCIIMLLVHCLFIAYPESKDQKPNGDDNGNISTMILRTQEGTVAKFSESAAGKISFLLQTSWYCT